MARLAFLMAKDAGIPAQSGVGQANDDPQSGGCSRNRCSPESAPFLA